MTHPEESALAAFAEGALDATERAAIEAHLGACADCRTVVATLLCALAVEPPQGQRIGRFLVLEPIGAGAIGEVFSAWDSTLERAVALKRLYPSLLGERDTRARVLAEARAAAKVQHPNVVHVFEVIDDGHTQAIVMELVPHAVTLRKALTGRPWREAVARYVDAARGLEAAHAAGVVHGDFKPDNVLLGDERVRVCDFGLARALPQRPLEARGDLRETSVSGTPAYLPPERWAGRPASAATDAWALCCSLWESLTGALPFDARDPASRDAQIKLGPAAPSSGLMPPALEALLRKGLAFAPEDRFPTLAALRHALQRLLTPRRLPLPVTLSILGVVAIGSVFGGAQLSRRATARACRTGATQLASGWTGPRRDAIRAALQQLEGNGFEDDWSRMGQVLDAWTEAWKAQWADACAATHERAEQSDAMLDLRLTCLRARLADSDALASRLETPSPKMIGHLVEAASRLPAPASCSAAELTRERQRLPPEAQRDAVATITSELAAVRAADGLGDPAEANRLAKAASEHARALGWKPTEAEALLIYGATQHRSGDTQSAILTLRQAVYAAEQADAPLSAARAWTELVRVLAISARLDEGRDAAAHARALFDRVGDERNQYVLATNLGELEIAERQGQRALEHYLEAKTFAVAADDRVLVAGALANIGRAQSALGRYAEAAETLGQSVQQFEAIHGPEHPNVAIALNNLASVELKLGRVDEALAHAERCVAIRRKMLGPQHLLVARSLGNVALAREARGELALAEQHYREVLAITAKSLGPEHPYNADPLSDLGRLERDRGDLVAAQRDFEEALRLRQAKLGLKHPDVIAARLQLVACDRLARRFPSAEARLAALENELGAAPPAELLEEQAELALARGRLDEARALAQRALGLRADGTPEARELQVLAARVALEANDLPAAQAHLALAAKTGGVAPAEYQLALARALWSSDRPAAEAALTGARRRWPKLQLDAAGRPRFQ